MDSFIFSVGILLIAGLTLAYGCGDALEKCSTMMTQMSGSLSDDYCAKMDAAKKCLSDLKGCDTAQQKIVEEALAKLSQDSMCGGDCIPGMQACSMKMLQMPNDQTYTPAKCKVLQDVLTCYEGLSCPKPMMAAIDESKQNITKSLSKCSQAGTAGGEADDDCYFQSCLTGPPNCTTVECIDAVKMKCDDDSAWADFYKGEVKTQYDTMSKSCKTCDFNSCAIKTDDCEKLTCFKKEKAACSEESWKKLYTGDFKTKFNKFEETCGCGSLQSSLLMVLASAVLVFLRSQF